MPERHFSASVFEPAGFNALLCLMFLFSAGLYAQPADDSEIALQYAKWIQQAVDETRWNDAAAALARANDFESVLSDISYLNAITNNYFGADRNLIIINLDNAIEINRWRIYSENQAVLLKAQMLIAVRDFNSALTCLNMIGVLGGSSAATAADTAMLRLLALRGIALGSGNNADYYMPSPGNIQAVSQFRSFVLSAMDSFPRDPRPLRIFFGYARNRMPGLPNSASVSDLPESDINLLEFILRRLPSLLETDPELAWMAAPFMRDTDEARRLLARYRAGGIYNIQIRDFMPHPASIPPALNLGLIDDFMAAEELFSGSVSYNNPLPPNITPGGNPVLDRDIINETYKLLRNEEGRDFFTRKLLSFTGIITCDEDYDGYTDHSAYYHSGVIRHFSYDKDQNNIDDMVIEFDANGVPCLALNYITGQSAPVIIEWERYPSVSQVTLGGGRETFRVTNYNWANAALSAALSAASAYPQISGSSDNGVFKFGPADFQYAPVNFIRLGGSRSLSGPDYPEIVWQYIDLSFRSLVAFCSSFTRPSVEIDGATETIYMSRGVLLQAVETRNGRQVSVTEFERGLPVIQHIDLDLDGRMETTRLFRRPPQDYSWSGFLDYRRLMASSESDFRGDGRYKTMEVYQSDGLIVYYFDMDGSGTYNYAEIRHQQ